RAFTVLPKTFALPAPDTIRIDIRYHSLPFSM
ncbi:hypothetical protein MTO96_030355, partial [Rhipicephalus appendiculatus]